MERSVVSKGVTGYGVGFGMSLFVSLFDNIDEMVYVVDLETYEILYANLYLKKLFDKRLVGELCYNALYGRSSPCESCINRVASKDGGKPCNWECYNPVLDRFYMVTDQVIRWFDGRDVRFEFAVDVTECKQLREKFEESKTMFLTIVSHELRTPITSIKGYVQMLLKQTLGVVPEQQRKALEVVLRNVNRLDHLIRDILDVSSWESGTMKFIPGETDLQRMIDEVVETMQSSADRKDIKIKTEVEEKLPRLVIDQNRIKQVFVHLLNNAIKFSPDGSVIHTRVKEEKDNILFEVHDSGVGIPKNKREEIFDTFYQVDSGVKRSFGGDRKSVV